MKTFIPIVIVLIIILLSACTNENSTLTDTLTETIEPTVSNESNSSNEVVGNIIKMSFNNNEIFVELTNNSATRDLLARLSNGPIELTFEDYASSEKIAYPNPALDLSDTSGYDPEVGDLMIYKPWNNLCAFYKDSAGYSNSLTLIGHILDNGIELLRAQTDEFKVIISLV